MIIAAAISGYLVGSLPTAGAIAALAGHDLRTEGSGNPGTNNALRLGGPFLAAMVLVVEVSKGVAAVLIGHALAGPTGMVAAGVAAATGNVYNVWYRFRGGKGLAISLGVLLATSPSLAFVALVTIIVVVAVTRSSGTAALAALAAMSAASVVAVVFDLTWPTLTPIAQLVLAVGLSFVLVRKHWRDSSLNPNATGRNPTSV